MPRNLIKNRVRIFLCLLLTLLYPFTALADTNPGPRLITVTGQAELLVFPDQILLSLGVETYHKDLAVAISQNDTAVKKILAQTQAYRIDPKNVQTDRILIEPRSNDGYNKNNINGYYIRKTITILIKDLSRFEEFFSAALKAGANSVYGIELQSTAAASYREQALRLAVAQAKTKANLLAAEMGERVGRPYSIQELTPEWMATASNASFGVFNASPSTGSFALGQIRIISRVTVNFEIENT